MLLTNKIAVIYGGAGAIGSEVARAFAAEGATVFVTGRSLTAVEAVDAIDETAVNDFLQRCVIEKVGKVDISFAAISIPQEGIQASRCCSSRPRVS